jgi:hypothetical protein
LAKLRQFGGDFDRLVEECAYEQWHRLLFPRFLAENGLLLHPHYGVALTLAECEELAEELGEPDGWMVAARFAAEILPGIFRLDDPCVRLRLAPEGRQALEQIVSALPREVFRADDALGWVYQFWQSERKDEINYSERKIGAAELGPVTQLFTENYMVRFLLENSLGAWWAARNPNSPLVKDFEFLRLDEEGRPAANAFKSWPDTVAQVTVMDPCCGSGHFLVEAFQMLWRMRAEEEGLDPIAAQDAVLSENLFGLELDARCVQIAMFAIALTAWKAGGGWRQLPVPNIACSGIPARSPLGEWTTLAKDDEKLEFALERLHALFKEADTLGSLIDPRLVTDFADVAGQQHSLLEVDFQEVAPLLEKAAKTEAHDPATAVLGSDAAGVARAAGLLCRTYTLVTTNVPYLEARSHSPTLRQFLQRAFTDAWYDLATCILTRAFTLSSIGGSVAVVCPQNWLLLKSYQRLRRRLLSTTSWLWLSWLGAGAFEEISGEVVNVALSVHENSICDEKHKIVGIDAGLGDANNKAEKLRIGPLQFVRQGDLSRMPDARFSLEGPVEGALLEDYAEGLAGIMTGDSVRFVRNFWEVQTESSSWEYFQSSVSTTKTFGGCESVLLWEGGRGGKFFRFHEENSDRLHETHQRGRRAWGKRGIVVRSIGDLPASLYTGERFDNNVAVLLPKDESLLAPIWAYVSSHEYATAVRRLDRKMNVTNATLVKVPFDVERWRRIAEDAGPLPEPWSDDSTQWLFEGRPEISTNPLQVGIARLVGYRWPAQPQWDNLTEFADADGIVSLPAVTGEPSCADRLQLLLARAFGKEWGPGKLRRILEQSGSSKKELAGWLRDDFFKLHCRLFHNRPFVWHVWDGRKDGFSALVNYHRLDRPMLEKLTHTYLGQDWIERQRAEVHDDVPGAEERLAAAENMRAKLDAILEGEPPYDIYVRWKGVHEQPLGWNPDLDDGVRLNIRPFVEAGVLRSSFNVHWKNDRGQNRDGSERCNDRHFTIAQKLKARQEHGLS